MMTSVLVERVFEEPVELEAIQELSDRGAWCLQLHRVRYIRTLFARDRRRMICIYEAPDAESVRIAQVQAGMPLTRVWSAQIIAPAPGVDRARQGEELIVVERTLEQTWTLEAVGQAVSQGGECLHRHGARYRGGFLSHDGRRMVCVFLAADAESVRLANRAAGVPFDCAWTASQHEPGS